MIRITYARDGQKLAEQIRDDLAVSHLASHPTLIVLVSRQSSADPHVQAEIEGAMQAGARILPVRIDDSPLPELLDGARALDFSCGYDRDRLLERVTMRPAELRRANRRAFALIGGIAALIFAIAVVAIISGSVAFPVAEYNEEATFQAQWVDGLIRETLAHVQPRNTEDALQFAATYEAAPTRLHFYIRGTATALAPDGSA